MEIFVFLIFKNIYINYTYLVLSMDAFSINTENERYFIFVDDSWYPPGHGDFYESFHSSGLLKQFIDGVRAFRLFSFHSNLMNKQ